MLCSDLSKGSSLVSTRPGTLKRESGSQMGLLWGCPLPLLAAVCLLGGCSGTSWNSLRFGYTMIWAPDQGMSDFIGVGYLDDQLSIHYNSTTRRAVPRVPWIRKVEEDDPHFWDWITRRAIIHEHRMKTYLMSLHNLYNLSRGVHTWQCVLGCELSKDGHKKWVHQYGYNGEDYLSFDKETLTWTAAAVPAQVTKRQWDADLTFNQLLKATLEEECIGWLQTLLDYAEESLLRREPPVVTVTSKADYDGLETLICQAHGFHPKEIDATWEKDGEVWEQETSRGGVVPNSDGTYHTWLSIRIFSEDRDRYRCHVEHDGLPEPVDLAWEAPASSWAGLLVGVLVVTVVVGLVAIGILLRFRRRRRDNPVAYGVPPIE